MRKTWFISALFLVILAGPARAQFFLEEGKVTLAVSGGDHVSRSLVLHNTTSEEVKVRAYWEDFQYVVPFDGSKQFYPAGTVAGSVGQWISFNPQEFVLPPMGKQVIDYAVNVPAGIEGGHYGVIFFERQDPTIDASGVSVVNRLGCLFFIEAVNSNKTAEIPQVQFVGEELQGKFVNKGNVVLIPKMTFYILDESGVAVSRGELASLYVAPAGTGDWKFKFPPDLRSGRYSLVLNADLGAGDVVVKEVLFTKDSSGSLLLGSLQ